MVHAMTIVIFDRNLLQKRSFNRFPVNDIYREIRRVHLLRN